MLASICTMPRDPIVAFPWPRAGHRNFSTTFPSRKNQRSLRCGTRLQADFCVWLEHDPHVEQYWALPHTFNWTSGNDKYRFTPHFLVAQNSGEGCYYEVQSEFIAISPPSETVISFAALCRTQNWGFRRIPETAVHTPDFRTLEKLYLRSLDATPEECSSLLEILPAVAWPASIRQILNACPTPLLAALCWALFADRFQVDLRQKLNLDFIIAGPITHETAA